MTKGLNNLSAQPILTKLSLGENVGQKEGPYSTFLSELVCTLRGEEICNYAKKNIHTTDHAGSRQYYPKIIYPIVLSEVHFL